jgi:hypothetical protein
MTTYLGLFFEILFLLAGIYLYLFSRGLIKTKQGGSFLNENKNLIRYGSLALIAIMLINISLHIRDILG